jgi:hypothetical protein
LLAKGRQYIRANSVQVSQCIKTAKLFGLKANLQEK